MQQLTNGQKQVPHETDQINKMTQFSAGTMLSITAHVNGDVKDAPNKKFQNLHPLFLQKSVPRFASCLVTLLKLTYRIIM